MDRRVLWAILLMMAIAIAPTFFLKKPAPRPPASEPAPPAAMGPAPDQTPLPERAVRGGNGGRREAQPRREIAHRRQPSADPEPALRDESFHAVGQFRSGPTLELVQ